MHFATSGTFILVRITLILPVFVLNIFFENCKFPFLQGFNFLIFCVVQIIAYVQEFTNLERVLACDDRTTLELVDSVNVVGSVGCQ